MLYLNEHLLKMFMCSDFYHSVSGYNHDFPGITSIGMVQFFFFISTLDVLFFLKDTDYWFWLTLEGKNSLGIEISCLNYPPIPATWRKPIDFFFFPFLSFVGIPSQRRPIMTVHNQKREVTSPFILFVRVSRLHIMKCLPQVRKFPLDFSTLRHQWTGCC